MGERQADSISLEGIASPAEREPGPLVILILKRTVVKLDSMGRTTVISRLAERAHEKRRGAKGSTPP
jgi:hypothetical protein